MRNNFDDKLNEIIKQLSYIGGQSKKNSEKFFFEIINKNSFSNLIELLEYAKKIIEECQNCFYLKIDGFCPSCMDERKDKNKICVVTNISDAKNMIDNEVFDGVFHVLKGEIDINKNIGPDKLKISELFDRINNGNVEVIIALNATFKGEVTSNYLIQELKSKKVKVSRLARGIPFGGVVNYVDKETMINAIKNRNKL